MIHKIMVHCKLWHLRSMCTPTVYVHLQCVWNSSSYIRDVIRGGCPTPIQPWHFISLLNISDNNTDEFSDMGKRVKMAVLPLYTVKRDCLRLESGQKRV